MSLLTKVTQECCARTLDSNSALFVIPPGVTQLVFEQLIAGVLSSGQDCLQLWMVLRSGRNRDCEHARRD